MEQKVYNIHYDKKLNASFKLINNFETFFVLGIDFLKYGLNMCIPPNQRQPIGGLMWKLTV